MRDLRPVAAVATASDPDHAVDLARRITSGAAFINAIVASEPRVPFGGTRRSGYGRELAAAGIHEFMNTRTYWLQTGPTMGR